MPISESVGKWITRHGLQCIEEVSKVGAFSLDDSIDNFSLKKYKTML